MTRSDEELEGRIQRLLAEDAEIAELGLDATHENNEVILRGQVNSDTRRDLIVNRVRELAVDLAPGVGVRSEITVTGAAAPRPTES
jgi:hypothetical protein